VFGSLKQLPFHSFNNGIIQVLDLEGWKGLKQKHLKNDICKMLVLKYLSLRRTEIARIPKKIRKLEHLETLDIRETHVKELPKHVEKLKKISSILGGSKNPRKGLKMPQEKIKEPKNGTSAQEKSKDTGTSNSTQEKNKEGMKQLRVLSGIEIVGESTAVDGLHQMTGLKKLAIYKLNIKKDGKTFTQLHSAIMYLFSCGLQTLAINDESSDFINSLDSMSAPPRYLVSLELSGKLERPPDWISKLHTLSKLTLSVTVLRTATFKLLKDLPSLFSLTFSFSAAKQDQDTIKELLEQNKSESDGEIFVPAGFPSLKLIRFFAPLVPKLGFGDNAMPALEMIQMRFEAFEGLFGIDTLENLREVHLRVTGLAAELNGSDLAEAQETETPETKERKEDAEITRFLVEDLKTYSTERLKVIADYIVNA
jgi:Leucine-rich repeat (LRR) protein